MVGRDIEATLPQNLQSRRRWESIAVPSGLRSNPLSYSRSQTHYQCYLNTETLRSQTNYQRYLNTETLVSARWQ